MSEKLCQILETELNLSENWDTSKNFIELGAQSIQMMKLQMEILKSFGVRLSFQELFENNTVQSLESCITKKLL